MTAAELVDVAEVERLRLRPGDTLVVKVPYWMNVDEYAQLSENMTKAFPDTKIVVLERGADLAVLRAEETPTP